MLWTCAYLMLNSFGTTDDIAGYFNYEHTRRDGRGARSAKALLRAL